MIHPRLILRQIARSKRQASIFVLCVALSLTSLTAFNGLSQSVNRSLWKDARKLHGGDIIIRSFDPLSDGLFAAVEALRRQKRVRLSKTLEFFSVVRADADQGGASLLSRLKLVQTNYPLYGEVVLQSGRPLHTALARGRVVVERLLLDRLGLRVGDRLRIGHAVLTIADVIVSASDRPLDFFTFGPRILIPWEEQEALGLIRQGSRIRHGLLLQLTDGSQPEPLAEELKRLADSDQERIDTYRTARSRVKRFLDNFLFFLKLVGLFILIMAGVGIQGTLGALLREKRATIAIMKTVGATNRYVRQHFMLLVAILGMGGIGLGILSGLGLQLGLARFITDFLPPGTPLAISWISIGEGALLGSAVIVVFTFLPLYRLQAVRPAMILRQELPAAVKPWPQVAATAMFLLLSVGIVVRHIADLKVGLVVTLGFGLLVLLSALLSKVMLVLLKRRSIKPLVLRQAVKGLYRPGNATMAIVVTLSAALTVILAIYLIERNLDETFVRAYPEHAPNLFCVDIQPHQRKAFQGVVGQDVTFYPIIRARVSAINGRPIDRAKERAKKRDNLARVFNLTYRQHLLADESLQAGQSLFQDAWEGAQVSVLDTVLEMGPMKIGDSLTFKIQGVPLTARIASIRTRSGEAFSPYFYFVFPETVLAKAPQTVFAALRVAPHQVAPMQHKIVAHMPNVSVIDLSATIRTFADLMRRLSKVVRLFSLFSMAAGLLILVSAIVATRALRILESVYYTILGAKRGFVQRIFALESAMIALMSTAVAVLLAQGAALWLCKAVFEIAYRPFWASLVAMAAGILVVVVAVGFWASRSILEQKPVTYLREQADG